MDPLLDSWPGGLCGLLAPLPLASLPACPLAPGSRAHLVSQAVVLHIARMNNLEVSPVDLLPVCCNRTCGTGDAAQAAAVPHLVDDTGVYVVAWAFCEEAGIVQMQRGKVSGSVGACGGAGGGCRGSVEGDGEGTQGIPGSQL